MVIDDRGIKGEVAGRMLDQDYRSSVLVSNPQTAHPNTPSPTANATASFRTPVTVPATMTSPLDPHTKTYSHINGSINDLLDRYAVSELCKGWPVYRDASEWQNYRSLFTDDGTVWTTWSGPQHVDDFISVSKAGKEKGVFIMHRECGTLAELNALRGRAIGKMKATITHRFTAEDGSQYDVDCDCRFIFFCQRQPSGGWKARYVKLFYEKDKVVPVDGFTPPRFSPEELARYPIGYRYLAAAQARLGYEIDLALPTASGELFERMYGEMEKWLEGEEIDLFWEKKV